MKLDRPKPPKSALFWAIAVAATLFVATGYSIAPAPPHHDGPPLATLPSEPTAAVPKAGEPMPRPSDDLPEPDPSLNSIGPGLP